MTPRRPPRAGTRPPAGDLADALAATERSLRLTAAPPLEVRSDAGGLQVRLAGFPGCWARVKGVLGRRHAWEKVEPGPDGFPGPADPPLGGTVTAFWAVEASGLVVP